MNYPLHNENKKHPEILTPARSSYSDAYAERMCDLYLSDHIFRNEQGELQEYYRLHARDRHTPEMALAYDIKCPKCGAILKQVARQSSCTELGLYTCKVCNKDQGGNYNERNRLYQSVRIRTPVLEYGEMPFRSG